MKITFNKVHYEIIKESNLDSNILLFFVFLISSSVRDRKYEWRRIHSKHFNIASRNQSRKYLQFLKDKQIITVAQNEGKETYEPGKNSKGYTLLYSNIDYIQIEASVKLKSKIKRYFSKFKKKYETLSKLKTNLEWFTRQIPNERFEECRIYAKAFLEDKQIGYALTHIDLLENLLLRGKRNRTNFRFDSNYTNLDRKIKQILFRGFYEIDISNSQYYFLGKLIHDLGHESPNLSLFTSLTKNGLLYEYIRDELKLPDRESAKKVAMQQFFSKKKGKLRHLFPDVFKVINEESKKEHIAIVLQKIEARQILDDFAHKFDFKFITIHDSFIVEEENAHIVIEAFNSLEFAPAIKHSKL